MPPEAVDYDRLEELLRALAHSRRLELLHRLQVPHGVSDIHLTPGRERAGDRPERPLAKQSVQEHLDKLVEIGVVGARDAAGAGRRGKEYYVNPQGVYQVLEELRRVGTITAGGIVSRGATVDAGASAGHAPEPGPKLLLVHGFIEGKAFPLRRSDLQGGGGWVVGCKPGLHVCLEYDPYVSFVNSEIALRDGEYVVSDLGSSRNGTWLNWRRVGSKPEPLRPGDVLGVGRSLLVFQAE